MSAGAFVVAFAYAAIFDGDVNSASAPWMQRAQLVANYHWQRQDADSGLFPNRPNATEKRFDGRCVDTSITGPWCHALLRAAEVGKMLISETMQRLFYGVGIPALSAQMDSTLPLFPLMARRFRSVMTCRRTI